MGNDDDDVLDDGEDYGWTWRFRRGMQVAEAHPSLPCDQTGLAGRAGVGDPMHLVHRPTTRHKEN